MTVLNGQASANRMVHTARWPAGKCLGAVDHFFQKPQSNRPGFYTYALRAWQGTPAQYRHTSRDIPAGAVVYLSAGPNGYGHICISVGNGTHVVSTDVPTGHIGVTTIEALERNWGRKFVGWSNWLMGYEIKNLGPTLAHKATAAAKPKPHKAALPLLKLGSTGPSVKMLQVKLGGLKEDGKFGPATKAKLVAYQKAHHLTPDGVCGPAVRKALGLTG